MILNSFETLLRVKEMEMNCQLSCFLMTNNASWDQICVIFCAYFESVYIDKNINVQSKPSLNHICISNYVISISTIYEEMANIDITKGPGPDGIPPSVLKYCSFVLSRPLHVVFNKSLASGIFPDFWKLSYLTPIFKSGNKADISNYRPVCNLSSIPKLFEKIVAAYLRSKLSLTVIEEQFGFLDKKSAELNLITFVDYLSGVLDVGGEVHAIYTDFSRAFDRVNHKLLIAKLETAGIQGILLKWIESYLFERFQTVKINNYKSKNIPNPSGVPQGSHLGPLLFVLFINDIIDCFKYAKFLCFADDLKCYLAISSPEDCLKLQSDLARLNRWCEINAMDLNIAKCNAISFTRKLNKTDFQYSIKGTFLSQVASIRDLGVIMDSTLSFVNHIDTIVSKALGMLGFIKRNTSDFKSINAIRLLYCTLVRPLLEYCSSVWSPHYACHIHRIEHVQRRFLRYLAYKSNIPRIDDYSYDFAALQENFSLPTLKIRRDQADLKIFFKLINYMIDCPSLISSMLLAVPARSTRSLNSFHQPFRRTNAGFNSYMPRVSRTANYYADNLEFFNISFNNFVRLLKINVI